MATKKAPAKKAPAKKAPETKEAPAKKASGAKRGAHLETIIYLREGDAPPDIVRFIRAVQSSGRFKNPEDVVTAMMRMAMSNARAMGPRYFGPQLKRYLK